MSEFLQGFARDFAALDKHNLERLSQLYSDDIRFTDPLHEVQGLPQVRRYFAELYANVSELKLNVHGFDASGEGQGYLRWTMTYRHPRLQGGQPIQVEGCSHLLWRDDKVYRHRDYFDAGALLYEHLPLLGRVIHWLKGRLA
ncbi:nuclear transport factor 2 family protein [Pseudomonas sp. MAFF 302030]|uniref:Nuclear transport factor 2 family protein n=1 Tax=Pseudomonas morbosilactucae TaxID=2938197 RepID=A0A9X2C7N0_9PSED|nr:nuclear transport factor 2 family protein [Pseudomonas morbosilactucae]MCK9800602.1 nuclear transport factor 2 family protein [Pseudomonas morbosilactucae]WEK09142.1 MAG: nuclear transport factor 2 family protein [Pseudomonas sp.]